MQTEDKCHWMKPIRDKILHCPTLQRRFPVSSEPFLLEMWVWTDTLSAEELTEHSLVL